MPDRYAEFVNILYTHLLLDPELAHWFTDADVTHVKRQQSQMGGFLADPGKRAAEKPRMAQVHKRLVGEGLDDASYDRFLGHVREAVREAGMDDKMAAEVIAAMEDMREAVMGRSA